jgi:hypothetical protein
VGGPGFGLRKSGATPTPAPTPSPTPQPNQAPIITLNGDDPQGRVNVTQGCPFIDPATANDPEDGNLTDSIIVEGSVNINAPRSYRLTYSVEDSGGLSDTKTREVIVYGSVSVIPPVCLKDRKGEPVTWLLSYMAVARMLMVFTY